MGTKRSTPGVGQGQPYTCTEAVPPSLGQVWGQTPQALVSHAVLGPPHRGKPSLPHQPFMMNLCHISHQCSDTLQGLFVLQAGGKSTQKWVLKCSIWFCTTGQGRQALQSPCSGVENQPAPRA